MLAGTGSVDGQDETLRLDKAELDRILKRIRECIRSENYRITEHARDESFEEGITMLEIMDTLLTGVTGRLYILTVYSI